MCGREDLIEQNPLRAGMVKSVGDYAWSSYCLNVRKQESMLIDRDENFVFRSLGNDEQERISKYKETIEATLVEKNVDEIRQSTRYGTNYISSRLQEQINELLPNKRKRGRPRIEKTLN